ncbi:MAG: hypothetical protein R3D65_12590 [Zhengella sp.]|uniref:hypothetical protein n=1 Tax=Zhengella sp. TaxID=2282762 RepID=UPI001D2F3219|nr:hypothetical protein [Notoacmeibacter sp.]MCC0028629.1 hypothetical protein [Brucellaceae bacterium]
MRKAIILFTLAACAPLAGCGTAAVVGAGATYAVTKAAVKTTVGAGKLAGRGVVMAGRAVLPGSDDATTVDPMATGSIKRQSAQTEPAVPVPGNRY